MNSNDIRKIYSRVPVRPLSKKAYESIISAIESYSSNIRITDENNRLAFKK